MSHGSPQAVALVSLATNALGFSYTFLLLFPSAFSNPGRARGGAGWTAMQAKTGGSGGTSSTICVNPGSRFTLNAPVL